MNTLAADVRPAKITRTSSIVSSVTSRRALISGAGLSAISLAVPSMAAARSRAGVRPTFARAHAEISSCDAELVAHSPIFDAARARWLAAQAAVPHVEFYHGSNVMGEPLLYSTRDEAQVSMCETVVANDQGRTMTGARKLVAAQRWRNRRFGRICRTSGMDAAYDRDCALSERLAAAETAFVAMPALSLAELRLKVETMTARDLWPDRGAADIITADVRRLAGEGR